MFAIFYDSLHLLAILMTKENLGNVKAPASSLLRSVQVCVCVCIGGVWTCCVQHYEQILLSYFNVGKTLLQSLKFLFASLTNYTTLIKKGGA